MTTETDLKFKFDEWFSCNHENLMEHFLIYQLDILRDQDKARIRFFENVFYTCPIDKSDKSFEGYIRKELIPRLTMDR